MLIEYSNRAVAALSYAEEHPVKAPALVVVVLHSTISKQKESPYTLKAQGLEDYKSESTMVVIVASNDDPWMISVSELRLIQSMLEYDMNL